MKRTDGLYKSDRHFALPEDSTPMKLYRIAFPKRVPPSQDSIETVPAGPYWPSCKAGPCDNGKEACPTPDACRIPEPAIPQGPFRLFAEGKWANIAVMATLIVVTVFVATYIATGHWPKYLF